MTTANQLDPLRAGIAIGKAGAQNTAEERIRELEQELADAEQAIRNRNEGVRVALKERDTARDSRKRLVGLVRHLILMLDVAGALNEQGYVLTPASGDGAKGAGQ